MATKDNNFIEVNPGASVPIREFGMDAGELIPFSRVERGYFDSFAVGGDESAFNAGQSWGALADDANDEEIVTREEFDGMAGQSGIPFHEGITRAETIRLKDQARLHNWRARQSVSLLPSMIGALPGFIASPAGIASLAVGVPAAGLLTRGALGAASTAVRSVGGSTAFAGGALGKIGAAGVDGYSNLLTGSIAYGAALVPDTANKFGVAQLGEAEGAVALPFTPEGVGLGLGLGLAIGGVKAARAKPPAATHAATPAVVPRLRAAPAADSVAVASDVGTDFLPPGAVEDSALSAAAAIEAPPVLERGPAKTAPRERLNTIFQAYEGGLGKWAADYADGVPSAREYATAQNISHDALDRVFQRAREDTVSVARRSPEQIEALVQAARTPTNAATRPLLEAAGMLGPDGNLLPPFAGLEARASAAPTAVPTVAVPFPARLSRIKPNYKEVGLIFESDLDRALYVLNANKAKPETLAALRAYAVASGIPEAGIAAAGKDAYNRVRAVAGNSSPRDIVGVPKVARAAPPVVSEPIAGAVEAFRAQGPDGLRKQAGLPAVLPPRRLNAGELITAIEEGRAFDAPPEPPPLPPPPAELLDVVPEASAGELSAALDITAELDELAAFATEQGIDPPIIAGIRAELLKLNEAFRSCRQG